MTERTLRETWAPVKDYEGLYAVSNLGRVIRLSDSKQLLTTQIGKCSYPAVRLIKDGAGRNFLVHRLVAEAFIPNPENKTIVWHRNGDPSDCYSTNLAWMSQKEIANNPDVQKRRSESMKKRHASKNPTR